MYEYILFDSILVIFQTKSMVQKCVFRKLTCKTPHCKSIGDDSSYIFCKSIGDDTLCIFYDFKRARTTTVGVADKFEKRNGFLLFFMHFCQRTMTTHAKSINSDLQRGLDSVDWTDVYDTHNIEHRTEPVNY